MKSNFFLKRSVLQAHRGIMTVAVSCQTVAMATEARVRMLTCKVYWVLLLENPVQLQLLVHLTGMRTRRTLTCVHSQSDYTSWRLRSTAKWGCWSGLWLVARKLAWCRTESEKRRACVGVGTPWVCTWSWSMLFQQLDPRHHLSWPAAEYPLPYSDCL